MIFRFYVYNWFWKDLQIDHCKFFREKQWQESVGGGTKILVEKVNGILGF